MINAKFAICNEVFDNYLLLLNLEKSPKYFSCNIIRGISNGVNLNFELMPLNLT